MKAITSSDEVSVERGNENNNTGHGFEDLPPSNFPIEEYGCDKGCLLPLAVTRYLTDREFPENIKEESDIGLSQQFELFRNNIAEKKRDGVILRRYLHGLEGRGLNIEIVTLMREVNELESNTILLSAIDSQTGEIVGYKDIEVSGRVGQFAYDYRLDPEEDWGILSEVSRLGEGIHEFRMRSGNEQHSFYVEQRWRRKGIGRILFSISLQLAQELSAWEYAVEVTGETCDGGWYGGETKRKIMEIIETDSGQHAVRVTYRLS